MFILKSKFRSAQTVCLRRSKFRSTSADRLSALTIYFKKINNIPKLTTVCLKIKFRSAQTVCLI